MSRLPLFACLFFSVSTALAQEKKDQPAQRTDEQILKSVKLPDGYTATVFASPPQIGYPTSVSAAIDGTIFVSVDENGSLDQKRNEPGKARGYVVRLRDTDGNGKADEIKRFAEMESPRGVIWDGPNGTAPGTLYVMAPPKLTAYQDTDGDGVSDKQEDIITGLSFDLGFRGADHTTNGCRLAIDGFIYIAVGDYGFTKAVAKDGTTLSMRGGGIVRIRPDGTGFEIVARGLRNIYDVAVSPTLDLFTRDNTNDGGGWNTRLSFVPPGAHMGYPTLFVNFPEDMLPALADYGGGSPCGALWLDEPGMQNGLYTVEWGRNAIMYHPLKPKGAGWELTGGDAKAPGQVEWIKLQRPTDIDVDASGALFITSWEGATYNYNGPNAGYVIRVVKKDAPKVAEVDLGKATEDDLYRLYSSPSATIRLAAQRALLQRATEDKQRPQPDEVQRIENWDARKGAVLTAKRMLDAQLRRKLNPSALQLGLSFRAASVSEEALVALLCAIGDNADLANASAAPVGRHLSNNSARVRAAAITALRRLAKHAPAASEAAGRIPAAAGETPALPGADAAPQILPLVADADPIISHLAIRALSELKASQVCFAAVDAAMSPGGTPAGRAGVPPAAAGILPAASGVVAPANSSTTSGSQAGASGTIEGSGRIPEPAGGTPAQPAAGGATPPADAHAVSLGALRALHGIYSAEVVEGLITRLSALNAQPSTSLKRGIFNALCRLDNQDAPYLDPKEWWGTRPDTSGPVYKPTKWAESEKIETALKRELDEAKGEDARWLIQRMYLCKVNFPGLIEQMLASCGNDTVARLTAIEGLFRPDGSLPSEGVKALAEVASNEEETPDLRARGLRLLQKGSDDKTIFPIAVASFAKLAGHDIGQPALAGAFEDFTRDGKNTKWIREYEKFAAGEDAAKRTLAHTVLVNLATSALVKGKEKEAAEKAVEKGWEKPETAASLLGAIARTKAKAYSDKVTAHLKDPNNAVAESALFAYQALGLNQSAAPTKTIGEIAPDMVVAIVSKSGGDSAQGKDIYLRAGCIACHTITADEPPKGPVLSAVAKMYDRAALTESIVKPNAKLAQGFESTWVKTKDGNQVEGFVTREGGDSVDLRNIAGMTVTVEKGDIAERGRRETSMMPEGLMNAFTPAELSNLLAYLESLKK